MLVQRLTKWLTNLLARLGTRWRWGTGSGAHVSGGGRYAAGSLRQQAASWLDDARRLRPPRAALATADPPHSPDDTPPHGGPRPTDRPLGRAAIPTHPLKPATAVPQNPTSPPKHLATPGAPQQPAVAFTAFGGHDAGETDVQAQRRLMSLKYLVRIGLYNEGFAPGALPEQYQRSVDDEGEDV